MCEHEIPPVNVPMRKACGVEDGKCASHAEHGPYKSLDEYLLHRFSELLLGDPPELLVQTLYDRSRVGLMPRAIEAGRSQRTSRDIAELL